MKKVLFGLILVFLFLGGCSYTDKKPVKFGATYMELNNPYFKELNSSIQEVLESNGDILITRDPDRVQSKQDEQIQEFIAEGLRAIFINPVDWKKIDKSIADCKNANIPVFIIDTPLYNSSEVTSTILSDNFNAGVQIAKDMMKKRSKANIAILYDDKINSTDIRIKGFMSEIKGDPNYKVTVIRNNSIGLEKAMTNITAIINRGVKVDVIFGANDPTALGALAALQKSHNKDNILIYGVDGSPEAKVMIKEGYMEGSSAQSPLQVGKIATETAYNFLDGKKIASKIIVPVRLITKNNIKEFDIAGWQ